MREKPFYQCEHCIYYTPYYNICGDRIWRVSCGHCSFRKKYIKLSLRDCKHFELLPEHEKVKQKGELVENYEKYICGTLHRIEKAVKYLKIYLNKDEDEQKLDNCLL